MESKFCVPKKWPVSPGRGEVGQTSGQGKGGGGKSGNGGDVMVRPSGETVKISITCFEQWWAI